MTTQLTNEVMRYTFHINSAMRSKGTNEDFWIDTAQIINRLAKDSQFIVQLNNVQIPFSFYQLSATSNLNRLPVYLRNVVDGGTGYYTTLIIPPGNYTPYTLITALNTALTTACATVGVFGFTPFVPTFATSYNPTNGYITFALTAPVGCQITLRFGTNSTTGQLAGFFGLGQADLVMTTSTLPTSTQPCVLNPVNYLCIRSSLKQYRNREFIVMRDDVSDILAKVPILTQQGTYVQSIEPTEPIYIIDNSITGIQFYLTSNLSYDPIDLQNLYWSFTFSISEVVRPDYQSIATTQAINLMLRQPVSDNKEELTALQKQRDELLTKLEVYKKKLEPKDVKKIEEAKKADEPKADQQVKPTNVIEWGSSSHLTDNPTVVYHNIFEDFPPFDDPSESEPKSEITSSAPPPEKPKATTKP